MEMHITPNLNDGTLWETAFDLVFVHVRRECVVVVRSRLFVVGRGAGLCGADAFPNFFF